MCELPILVSWDIPIGISSTRSTLKKCTVFSKILVIIHSLVIQLLIDFWVLHNLRGVFRIISKIYDPSHQYSEVYAFRFPKPFASVFYCFQICKKISRQFKILAILYFYGFIIIFNLTLQKVLLVTQLNKVRNFCQQMSSFSIPL